eukprot:2477609-Prorocentrum_lima.AAC.1
MLLLEARHILEDVLHLMLHVDASWLEGLLLHGKLMVDAMVHCAPAPLPEPHARLQRQHEDVCPGRTGANGDHAMR